MNDAGEFVVVSFPERTNLSTWTLSDEQSTSDLSNRTVSGRVAFSTAPNRTENLTTFRVLPLENLSLANSGETVTLRRTAPDGSATRTMDSVTYVDAPNAECWRPTTKTWRPLGATNFSITRSDATTARVFVLPDDPGVPVETLRSAEHRILLAGYSFTSRRVTNVLIAAERRGVNRSRTRGRRAGRRHLHARSDGARQTHGTTASSSMSSAGNEGGTISITRSTPSPTTTPS